MRVVLILPLLCMFRPALRPQELAPEVLTLAKIKVKMEENLKRLPNYTCTMTIERSRRLNPSKSFRLIDTLRLEVAFVGNKELYSWPGAEKFEEREIQEIVPPGGAIGTGAFALHARAVFLSSVASFTWVGERIRDGRRTLRYDYRVPQYRSGYRVKVSELEGIAGYHGSIWVDAETLDLIRLEIETDDVPVHVPLKSSFSALEYQRVEIGATDFLLPRSWEMAMTDTLGNESRNLTEFSSCRQYTGESVISFGEPPPDAPAPVKPLEIIKLPADLEIPLRLETPIDSATGFAGAPVTASVDSDVKKRGQVLVPKGATLRGRVALMQKFDRPFEYYRMRLDFDSLEFSGKRAAGRFEMMEILVPDTGLTGLGNIGLDGAGRPVSQSARRSGSQRPIGGLFYVKGSRFTLSKGLRFSCRTRSEE